MRSTATASIIMTQIIGKLDKPVAGEPLAFRSVNAGRAADVILRPFINCIIRETRFTGMSSVLNSGRKTSMKD